MIPIAVTILARFALTGGGILVLAVVSALVGLALEESLESSEEPEKICYTTALVLLGIGVVILLLSMFLWIWGAH